MVTKSDTKNYFDVHSIIALGKADVRDYTLPIGAIIKIRPLSDLEIELSESVLLSNIKDKKTREFIFGSDDKIDTEKISEAIKSQNDEKEIIVDVVKNLDINYEELYIASTKQDIRIAYLAMKDFTDSFDENDLMCLNGIRELAEEVKRISGYSKETLKEIDEFRQE